MKIDTEGLRDAIDDHFSNVVGNIAETVKNDRQAQHMLTLCEKYEAEYMEAIDLIEALNRKLQNVKNDLDIAIVPTKL